jgi:hypothetical protein
MYGNKITAIFVKGRRRRCRRRRRRRLLLFSNCHNVLRIHRMF